MTHREVIELLPWHANGTLQPGQRQELESHLKDCPECKRELDELRALQSSVAGAAENVPEPSPFLFTRALARVEEYEREKARRRWWQLSPRLAGAVIAAQFALILLTGGLLMQRERQFAALSGPAVGTVSGPRIVLGFQEGVSEQTMRQTIRGLNGNVVAGPSALGLYTVELPRDRDVDRTLEQLRQDRGTIRLAALQP
jgi:anti-sigma factor RsiW